MKEIISVCVVVGVPALGQTARPPPGIHRAHARDGPSSTPTLDPVAVADASRLCLLAGPRPVRGAAPSPRSRRRPKRARSDDPEEPRLLAIGPLSSERRRGGSALLGLPTPRQGASVLPAGNHQLSRPRSHRGAGAASARGRKR